MIYVFLIITLSCLIIGLCSSNEDLSVVGGALSVAFLFIWIGAFGTYNYKSTTVDGRLAVLNEQNQIVLSQIEPIVQHALKYESDTYKDLKLDLEKVISFSNIYPELKANNFLNRQIDIMLANQAEIKQLKLEKVSLNAYHFWLWTPKK